MNVRSIRNKTLYLNDYILTHNYDIFAVSETWLSDSEPDNLCIKDLLPAGYQIKRVDRSNGQRGGGVAIIHKQSLNISLDKLIQYVQFECMSCTVHQKHNSITFYVFYRPPPNQVNGLKTSAFLNEWSEFLSHETVLQPDIVMVGDINIHMDDPTHHHTRCVNDYITATGLQQHIHEPTHYHGHTIDVLITRCDSSLVENIVVTDIGLCDNDSNLINDHYAIAFTVNLPITAPTKSTISYRNYKGIDTHAFTCDVRDLEMLNNMNSTVDELTITYITGLAALINTHAPTITNTITLHPDSPWYNDDLRTAKTLRRKKERELLLKGGKELKVLYKKQCSVVAKGLFDCKTNYYSQKVIDCGRDTKALFRVTNMLLKTEQQTLPTSDNDTDLAERFLSFFVNKIENIRSKLLIYTTAATDTDTVFQGTYLTELRPCTDVEIRAIIMKTPSKSCELDPLPTWLLKKCVDVLLPYITALVNSSITAGVFPTALKDALIRPILKKSTLDPEQLKNYRPISNLNFLSKLIEKVVMNRLDEHMNNNNLHDLFQSAYRGQHSTETAILKIHNDIIDSLDSRKCTLLASLDLSAAFDTVDHTVFLKRLRQQYGVQGSAFQWFSSYLHDRHQSVVIKGCKTEPTILKYGVPQGSVIGARMYTMYTKPLSEITKKHNVLYHSYADDTQLYVQCENTDAGRTAAIEKLQSCISEICDWMKLNALQLNEEKTSFIIFCHDKQHTTMTLKLGDKLIPSTTSIKILGVIFDSNMTLELHIINICKSVHMHIRKIRHIRKYLSDFAVKTLVQCTVISRIDYCNSILNGLPVKTIAKLQLAQNAAARLISGTPRREHISPVLLQLHWLPVSKRCQFKLLVMVYKALHGTMPLYICELINWYHPARPLRSAAFPSLVPNRNKTVMHGRRLCDTAAAVLWNNLPIPLRCSSSLVLFKKLLKTHLF